MEVKDLYDFIYEVYIALIPLRTAHVERVTEQFDLSLRYEEAEAISRGTPSPRSVVSPNPGSDSPSSPQPLGHRSRCASFVYLEGAREAFSPLRSPLSSPTPPPESVPAIMRSPAVARSVIVTIQLIDQRVTVTTAYDNLPWVRGVVDEHLPLVRGIEDIRIDALRPGKVFFNRPSRLRSRMSKRGATSPPPEPVTFDNPVYPSKGGVMSRPVTHKAIRVVTRTPAAQVAAVNC
jgi:hypothetical protein